MTIKRRVPERGAAYRRPIYNPRMKHVAARTLTRALVRPLARPAAVSAAAALLGLSSLALAQGTPSPVAPQPKKAESPAQIKSAGSYSLGVSMGENLRRASVDANAISMQRLMRGLQDALAGKAQFGPADQESIRTLIVSTRARIGNANHAAARAFLARNGKKKGIVTTASGLEYEVVKAGQGSAPKPGDIVTVNYRGTLLNGTEFDSSYKRGQPATFPVDRVIPGWQEALKLMKPGAKWRLFVPPQLAYDLNSPPPIPPGSMLIFDVDLLGIQQQPQPQMPMTPAHPGQTQQSGPPGQPHP
jgi:FKBP-type peptidyl-prolyl cis-trans isomerase